MSEPALFLHGQPGGYNFLALEDPATTSLVKSGKGFLSIMTITGGTAGTVILYDNTEGSGTIIANISSSNSLRTINFENLVFQTGLVVATTAVDSPRLTITYR